jgi:hypothetical protein
MVDYTKRTGTDAVERDDGYIVGPENEAAWAEYQAWLAEGNFPHDPPVPPVEEPIPLPEKLAAMGIDVNELRALLNSTTTV